MEKTCCMVGCKITNDFTSRQFYQFPSDLNLCRKWAASCGDPQLLADLTHGGVESLATKTVCSWHFDSFDFIDPEFKRLKPNAVPKFSQCDLVKTESDDYTRVTYAWIKNEDLDEQDSRANRTGDYIKKEILDEDNCSTILNDPHNIDVKVDEEFYEEQKNVLNRNKVKENANRRKRETDEQRDAASKPKNGSSEKASAADLVPNLQSSESQPPSRSKSTSNLRDTSPGTVCELLESSDSDSSPIMIKPSSERKKRRYFAGDIETEECNTSRKSKKYFHGAATTSTKQRKHLASLNKVVNTLKEEVNSLQTLLKVLREKYYISEIAEQSLEASIPENAKQIFKRMIQGPTKSKYNPALRSFALTLNFYSPSAYEYVRETFSNSLPHPSVLSKWYQTVDGSPGFLKESLNALRVKVEEAKNSNKQIFCNLVLDEMDINSQVEWTGSKLTGYIDVGSNIDSDALPEAKEALMFMVVALNSFWKIPVAYFLINGIGGAEKANLLIKVLEFIHDSGIVVTSVTFDGAASNFVMAKCLGGNFNNPNSLQTSFPHPITKKLIYLFPDPCHMMKLVRHCIGSQTELEDENGDSIKWEYVEKLVHLQHKDAGTKIRRRHLEWEREKIKVKLATQTLSKSVADALIAMQESGNENFQGVGPTSKFILYFNNMFDIFNSRNRLCKYMFQRPLSNTNYLSTFDYLNEAKEYILSIKLKGSSILASQRKAGFLGFLICIESLNEMYHNYVDRDNLKYLLTYKLSLDHLELFFGAIRSQAGFNNNPTARQIEAALKRLIVRKDVTAGNAINLENVAVLHCTGRSPTTTAEGDDSLLSFEQIGLLDKILEQVSQNNFTSSAWDLTDYTEDIVSYIAGFVVQVLKKTVSCGKCFELLEDHIAPSKLKAQIEYKNLTTASLLVVNICKCGEKYFRFYHKINNVFNKNVNNLYNVLIPATLKTIPDSVSVLFGDHMFDEFGFENHFICLSKLILKTYFKLRVHYETSKMTRRY